MRRTRTESCWSAASSTKPRLLIIGDDGRVATRWDNPREPRRGRGRQGSVSAPDNSEHDGELGEAVGVSQLSSNSLARSASPRGAASFDGAACFEASPETG